MLKLLFLGCVVVAALVTLFMRLAPSARRPDRRPRIPAPRLRAVVIDLLRRLGLEVVEEELRGHNMARRLVAVRDGELRGARCLVFVEPAPPGDLVPPPLVEELAESVRTSSGAVGLLVTPYRIPAGPLDVPVELVDGARLRQLVAAYLPEQLAELDGYFGFPSGASG